MEEKKLTMKTYVVETPEAVLANVKRSEELTKSLVDAYLEKEFKRVVIIASGSSYNGSLCAVNFLRKVLNKEVKLLSPFTFVHYDNNVDEDDFVLVVSQSGKSTNSLEAIQVLKEKGLKKIGITGNVESDFKDECDLVCDWGVGIELVGYVTKGVITLAEYLMLFGIEAQTAKGLMSAEENKCWKDSIVLAMDAHKQLQASSLKFIESHQKELLSMKDVWLVGAGSNFATCVEGALKIGETVKIHATAYETEEFLHGPCYPINPDFVTIIYDSNRKDAATNRMHEIYQACKFVSDKTYIVTNDPRDGEDAITTDVVLPEEILPLAYLAVAPLLAEFAQQTLKTDYHPLYAKFKAAVPVKSARHGAPKYVD